MRKIAQGFSALIPVGVLAAVGWLLVSGNMTSTGSHPLPRETQTLPREMRLQPGKRTWYDGVALARLSDLNGFVRATGSKPQVVQMYIGLARPFPEGAVRAIIQRGALPLLQVNPRHLSLAAIASGKYDSYLREDARVIHALGRQVALSFAHEANGSWFSWGCTRQPASEYIAAWRHVHDVIGDKGVTWVWTVNHTWNGTRCGLLARYPGPRYVNWIGIDGYLRKPSDTFASIFDHTVRQLRPLHKPILLTEAGVQLGTNNVQRLISIYRGARAAHLLGVIYFDSATQKGDYRPQDNPAVLAEFRRLVRQYAQ